MTRRKKTILLVEDNEIDRRMLEGALKAKGFLVIALSDPASCLEVIALRKPDILLLDQLLPHMPGNKLLHLVREKYSAIELPVLMTTVKGAARDIIESLALGANDYIVKPIDFEVALMRINTQLTLVELSREIARLKGIESIAALITTYNHEINNPLAIAISSLKGLEALKEEKSYLRLERALWRIAEIVKQVKGAISAPELQLKDYAGKSKLIKLK